MPRRHGVPLEESLLKCNLYNTAAETPCNVSNGLSNAPRARTQARTGTDEGWEGQKTITGALEWDSWVQGATLATEHSRNTERAPYTQWKGVEENKSRPALQNKHGAATRHILDTLQLLEVLFLLTLTT